MRLVNSTGGLSRFGEERAIGILARAGFDALDWSFENNFWDQDDWRERALHMKAIAEDCGIGFSQGHAATPTSTGEEPFDTDMLQKIIRTIEIAGIMGIQNLIVHPRQHLPYRKHRQQLFDESVALYKSLIPYCEEFGVRVCTENMWQCDYNRNVIIDSVCSQAEEFCAMVDAVDSPWIAACLDIGHGPLVGSDPVDMIHALGKKRLKALHVHDVDYLHDDHTLPFLKKLDWEAIMKALAEIDYREDFTYEAGAFIKAFPEPLHEDACRLMERTGRYLISRIEANRP